MKRTVKKFLAVLLTVSMLWTMVVPAMATDDLPVAVDAAVAQPEQSAQQPAGAEQPAEQPAQQPAGAEQPAEPVKADEPAQSEKTEQPAEAQPEQTVSQEKADEPAQQPAEPAQSEKTEQPAEAVKADEPAQSEKTEQPAEAEKSEGAQEQPTEPAKADEPAQQPAAQPAEPAQSENTEQPAEPAKADETAGTEGNENTENSAGGEAPADAASDAQQPAAQPEQPAQQPAAQPEQPAQQPAAQPEQPAEQPAAQSEQPAEQPAAQPEQPAQGEIAVEVPVQADLGQISQPAMLAAGDSVQGKTIPYDGKAHTVEDFLEYPDGTQFSTKEFSQSYSTEDLTNVGTFLINVVGDDVNANPFAKTVTGYIAPVTVTQNQIVYDPGFPSFDYDGKEKTLYSVTAPTLYDVENGLYATVRIEYTKDGTAQTPVVVTNGYAILKATDAGEYVVTKVTVDYGRPGNIVNPDVLELTSNNTFEIKLATVNPDIEYGTANLVYDGQEKEIFRITGADKVAGINAYVDVTYKKDGGAEVRVSGVAEDDGTFSVKATDAGEYQATNVTLQYINAQGMPDPNIVYRPVPTLYAKTTIAKAAPTVTVTPASGELTYTGAEQTIFTVAAETVNNIEPTITSTYANEAGASTEKTGAEIKAKNADTYRLMTVAVDYANANIENPTVDLNGLSTVTIGPATGELPTMTAEDLVYEYVDPSDRVLGHLTNGSEEGKFYPIAVAYKVYRGETEIMDVPNAAINGTYDVGMDPRGLKPGVYTIQLTGVTYQYSSVAAPDLSDAKVSFNITKAPGKVPVLAMDTTASDYSKHLGKIGTLEMDSINVNGTEVYPLVTLNISGTNINFSTEYTQPGDIYAPKLSDRTYAAAGEYTVSVASVTYNYEANGTKYADYIEDPTELPADATGTVNKIEGPCPTVTDKTGLVYAAENPLVIATIEALPLTLGEGQEAQDIYPVSVNYEVIGEDQAKVTDGSIRFDGVTTGDVIVTNLEPGTYTVKITGITWPQEHNDSIEVPTLWNEAEAVIALYGDIVSPFDSVQTLYYNPTENAYDASFFKQMVGELTVNSTVGNKSMTVAPENYEVILETPGGIGYNGNGLFEVGDYVVKLYVQDTAEAYTAMSLGRQPGTSDMTSFNVKVEKLPMKLDIQTADQFYKNGHPSYVSPYDFVTSAKLVRLDGFDYGDYTGPDEVELQCTIADDTEYNGGNNDINLRFDRANGFDGGSTMEARAANADSEGNLREGNKPYHIKATTSDKLNKNYDITLPVDHYEVLLKAVPAVIRVNAQASTGALTENDAPLGEDTYGNVTGQTIYRAINGIDYYDQDNQESIVPSGTAESDCTITIEDASGNPVAIDGTDILDAGEYTVTLTAGDLGTKGNCQLTNNPLTLKYTVNPMELQWDIASQVSTRTVPYKAEAYLAFAEGTLPTTDPTAFLYSDEVRVTVKNNTDTLPAEFVGGVVPTDYYTVDFAEAGTEAKNANEDPGYPIVVTPTEAFLKNYSIESYSGVTGKINKLSISMTVEPKTDVSLQYDPERTADWLTGIVEYVKLEGVLYGDEVASGYTTGENNRITLNEREYVLGAVPSPAEGPAFPNAGTFYLTAQLSEDAQAKFLKNYKFDDSVQLPAQSTLTFKITPLQGKIDAIEDIEVPYRKAGYSKDDIKAMLLGGVSVTAPTNPETTVTLGEEDADDLDIILPGDADKLSNAATDAYAVVLRVKDSSGVYTSMNLGREPGLDQVTFNFTIRPRRMAIQVDAPTGMVYKTGGYTASNLFASTAVNLADAEDPENPDANETVDVHTGATVGFMTVEGAHALVNGNALDANSDDGTTARAGDLPYKAMVMVALDQNFYQDINIANYDIVANPIILDCFIQPSPVTWIVPTDKRNPYKGAAYDPDEFVLTGGEAFLKAANSSTGISELTADDYTLAFAFAEGVTEARNAGAYTIHVTADASKLLGANGGANYTITDGVGDDQHGEIAVEITPLEGKLKLQSSLPDQETDYDPNTTYVVGGMVVNVMGEFGDPATFSETLNQETEDYTVTLRYKPENGTWSDKQDGIAHDAGDYEVLVDILTPNWTFTTLEAEPAGRWSITGNQAKASFTIKDIAAVVSVTDTLDLDNEYEYHPDGIDLAALVTGVQVSEKYPVGATPKSEDLLGTEGCDVYLTRNGTRVDKATDVGSYVVNIDITTDNWSIVELSGDNKPQWTMTRLGNTASGQRLTRNVQVVPREGEIVIDDPFTNSYADLTATAPFNFAGVTVDVRDQSDNSIEETLTAGANDGYTLAVTKDGTAVTGDSVSGVGEYNAAVTVNNGNWKITQVEADSANHGWSGSGDPVTVVSKTFKIVDLEGTVSATDQLANLVYQPTPRNVEDLIDDLAFVQSDAQVTPMGETTPRTLDIEFTVESLTCAGVSKTALTIEDAGEYTVTIKPVDTPHVVVNGQTASLENGWTWNATDKTMTKTFTVAPCQGTLAIEDPYNDTYTGTEALPYTAAAATLTMKSAQSADVTQTLVLGTDYTLVLKAGEDTVAEASEENEYVAAVNVTNTNWTITGLDSSTTGWTDQGTGFTALEKPFRIVVMEGNLEIQDVGDWTYNPGISRTANDLITGVKLTQTDEQATAMGDVPMDSTLSMTDYTLAMTKDGQAVEAACDVGAYYVTLTPKADSENLADWRIVGKDGNGWTWNEQYGTLTKTFNVAKRKATLEVTTKTVTYDGKGHLEDEFITQVKLVPEKIDGEQPAAQTEENFTDYAAIFTSEIPNFQPVNVGTYPMTVAVYDEVTLNYDVPVANANGEIVADVRRFEALIREGDVFAQNSTYEPKDFVTSAGISGFEQEELLYGEDFTVTIADSTGKPVQAAHDAGAYTVTATLTNKALIDNYGIEVTVVTGTFTITPQTATLTVVPAINPIYYNGAAREVAEFAPVVTLSGEIDTQIDIAGKYTVALDREAVKSGEYVLTAEVTDEALLRNYDFTAATNSAVISQMVVTVQNVAGQGKVYGASDAALDYTVVGSDGQPNEAAKAALKDSLKLSRAAGELAGGYDYILTAGETVLGGTPVIVGEYSVAFAQADQYVVSPLPVTVAVTESLSKTYGEPDDSAAINANYSITVNDATTLKTAADAQAELKGAVIRGGAEEAGSYPFMFQAGEVILAEGVPASNAINPNYLVTFTSGGKAYTIGKLAVTVTVAQNQGKLFGVPDDEIAIANNFNVAWADTVNLWPAVADKAAKEAKIKEEIGGILSRVKGDNGEDVGVYEYAFAENGNPDYVVTFDNSADKKTYTVSPLPITLTVSAAQSKNYGAADNASAIAGNYGVSWGDAQPTLLAGEGGDIATAIRSQLATKLSREAGEGVGSYGYIMEAGGTRFTADAKDTKVGNYLITYDTNGRVYTINPVIDGAVSISGATNNATSFTLSTPSLISEARANIRVEADKLNGATMTNPAALAYDLTVPASGSTGAVVATPVSVAPIAYSYQGVTWNGGLPATVAGGRLVLTMYARNRAGEWTPVTFTYGSGSPAVSAAQGIEDVLDIDFTVSVTEYVNGYAVGDGYALRALAVGSAETGSATVPFGMNAANNFEECLVYSAVTGGAVTTHVLKLDKAGRHEINEAPAWGIVKALSFADASQLTAVTVTHPLGYDAKANKLGYDDGVDGTATAKFPNRADNVDVSGINETVRINSMTVADINVPGANREFNGSAQVPFTEWKTNVSNLPSGNGSIRGQLTDKAGHVAEITGSTSPSPAPVNASIRLTGSDKLTGKDTALQIGGDANCHERLILTVGGKTYNLVVEGPGTWSPSANTWVHTLNLSEIDLPIDVPTEISVRYADLSGGGATMQITYDPRTMGVMVTSPFVAGMEHIIGFCEGTQEGNNTVVSYKITRGDETFTGRSNDESSACATFDMSTSNVMYYDFLLDEPLQVGDKITVTYSDNYNTTSKDFEVVADTQPTKAEPMGIPVISGRDEWDKDQSKDARQYFVQPIDLGALKDSPMEIPLVAYAGFKVGSVTVSLDDNGNLVATPDISRVICDKNNTDFNNMQVKVFDHLPTVQELDEVKGNQSIDAPQKVSGKEAYLYVSYDVKLFPEMLATDDLSEQSYFLITLTDDENDWYDAVDFGLATEDDMKRYVDMNTKPYVAPAEEEEQEDEASEA